MSSLLFAFSDDDCDGNGNDEVTSNVDPTSNPSNCPVTNDGRDLSRVLCDLQNHRAVDLHRWRGGVSGTSAFSFSAAGFDASAANEDMVVFSSSRVLRTKIGSRLGDPEEELVVKKALILILGREKCQKNPALGARRSHMFAFDKM